MLMFNIVCGLDWFDWTTKNILISASFLKSPIISCKPGPPCHIFLNSKVEKVSQNSLTALVLLQSKILECTNITLTITVRDKSSTSRTKINSEMCLLFRKHEGRAYQNPPVLIRIYN